MMVNLASMHPAIIRAIGVLLPLVATGAALLYVRPGRRQGGAAMLATLWATPALFLVNTLAVAMGLWHFSFQGGGLLGLPADLMLGWAFLWGAFPALLFARRPLWLVLVVMAGIDLLLMPMASPLLSLSGDWWLGELFALVVVLLPAQLLARWTTQRTKVLARAALQVGMFAGIVLWLVPALLFAFTGGSWSMARYSPWLTRQLVLQAAILASVLGLAAVQEFAERGRGTPFPLDPPALLVRSGPYAYLRNPMQTSATLLLILMAILFRSYWLALAAVGIVAYSEGFASWDEGEDLHDRFGDSWDGYRHSVRRWIPRWKPRPAAPGVLYVAATCETCHSIGLWFAAQRAIELRIEPAESHPSPNLRRIRYESDAFVDEGIGAIARALEHIHVGWALVAFASRLPVARPLIQLIVDATGGGPRTLTTEAQRARR